MSEPPISQQAAQAVAAQQLEQHAAEAPGTDAGPSLEQMQSDQRSVLLPMEQKIDAMIAQFQQAQDSQAREIADLRAQLAAARQDVGAPAVEQYARGVATLVKAHAAANPDVPADRFGPALAAAEQLRAAASSAVESRDPSQVYDLIATLERWAAKGVGKHLELAALRSDLEGLGEAAARLAA